MKKTTSPAYLSKTTNSLGPKTSPLNGTDITNTSLAAMLHRPFDEREKFIRQLIEGYGRIAMVKVVDILISVARQLDREERKVAIRSVDELSRVLRE